MREWGIRIENGTLKTAMIEVSYATGREKVIGLVLETLAVAVS